MVQLYLLVEIWGTVWLQKFCYFTPGHYSSSLHKSKQLQSFCYPPSPPFGGVLLCYVSIKFGGSLLVVRLSLRCDFPRAFGIAYFLPWCAFWHCLYLVICHNLVRSSPWGAGEIRKALPGLSSSCLISEACVFVVLITCHRVVSPFPPITPSSSYCLICPRALVSCVTFSCVS